MRPLFLLLTFFFLSHIAPGQDYIKLALSGERNFYAIQKKFDAYWKDKTPQKGQGYKQFRRWEQFISPRVYPSGNLPDPMIAWREARKYRKSVQASAPSLRSTNVWSQYMTHDTLLFTQFSTIPGHGRVSCVEVHPDTPSIIYIGTPSGGLWKSENFGSSWIPLTDDLPVIGVADIAISPKDPNIMYLATGDNNAGNTYSIGVLKSTDGGLNWDSTGLNYAVSNIINIRRLLMHPENTDTLWAATVTGIMRTNDGGQSWTQVHTGNMRDIEFKPGSPDTLFATSAAGFYLSTDGGQQFSNSGLPENAAISRMELATSESDPDRVYVIAADASNSGLYGFYISDDAGQSFSLSPNSKNILGYFQAGGTGGQAWFDMDVTVDPQNENNIFTAGINIWKSTDGGMSFAPTSDWTKAGTSEYVHGDVHNVEFFGNRLYTTCDGGIFYTDNQGGDWVDISSNLTIHQIYSFNHSPFNSENLIAGMQDVGSSHYDGQDWTTITWGDGFNCYFDWTDSLTYYTSAHFGQYFKSINGLNGFSLQVTPGSETSAFATVLRQDHWDPDVLYLGLQNVWQSTNGAQSWTRISNFGNPFPLQRVEVSKSNSQVIYATSNSWAYRTLDGGNLWTGISTGLPTNQVAFAEITIDPKDHLNVFAGFSGYANGLKVYNSTDAGTTWTNISGSLPNLPVNCILLEESSLNGIYVGMDVGVYYKNDTLADWIPYFDDLPNVIVNDLQIIKDRNLIRAATFGRGVWEAPTISTPLISSVEKPLLRIDHAFTVYPNPSSGPLKLKLTKGTKSSRKVVRILDIHGVQLDEQVLDQERMEMDMPELKTGTYFIQLEMNGEVQTTKWTKF